MSELTLEQLAPCFEGSIPAVVATADAAGIPNVTYLSRVVRVDAERVALSNQFFSKTARNLAENPRASLLLIDPFTHDEYRLAIAYERTERRGPVFDRLRTDVDAIAAISGMQDVFRLRAADIYRVTDIARIPPNPHVVAAPLPVAAHTDGSPVLPAVADLCARMARCQDLDTLMSTTVDGLDRMLGYRHVHLLLVDEDGHRLFTMASRGYDAESIGAEVLVGEGIIGMAAAQAAPLRIGNLLQMAKYSRTVRREYEHRGGIGPGREVPMPGLPGADSAVVVPAVALGQVVGVLAAERTAPVAFGPADEAVLGIVATILANAVEVIRAAERDVVGEEAPVRTPAAPASRPAVTTVRFFAVDGSTFLDGEYLIKGVAGRILWSLLREHVAAGRVDFTNRELRLDPSLEMPGFKDNLESRLILLKRRLDERDAPVRIEKTGRGRFRLDVATSLRLEVAE
jgi:predicted pyridoxine 5'-phosphate oxidase superfamily flavin-nucleotide-binding protein